MFKAAEVLTILGKRGSGKTTLCKHAQRHYPRLIIFDLLGEYRGLRGPDIFHVSSLAGFGQALKLTLDRPQFKIIIRVNLRDPDREAVFEELMILCYERKKFATQAGSPHTSIQVVIDEVHEYCHAHYMPAPFKEALLLGRHQEMGLILASQRPANVHKDILAQSHHLFCSLIVETNDFNYLKGYFGPDPEKLKSLPKYHFLWKSDDRPLQVVKVTPI
jgi:energy-coupling factor transporter ATP-binding protein EcfA2